jgi:peptidoglycan/LPS O-acetylase OafA/YrhL
MINKVFFKGLNELRAIAAIAVIFHHIELFKNRDKLPSLFDTPLAYFITYLGKNGVYLFFVLSGFLITYLLLSEKFNGKINLKKFYLRRIFRIWPLYYFIILISFILIPYLADSFDIFQQTSSYFERIKNIDNYSSNSLLCYLFFIPNIALYLNYIVVGCSQTWSVGVEEQFYIVWPILILLFNKKIMPFIFLIMIGIMTVFTLVYAPIIPFEYMSIGALGGYFLFYFKNTVVDVINSIKFLYLGLIVFVFILLLFPVINQYLQTLLVSVCFALLILYTVSAETKTVFINKQFSFLGQISYGIYMYHPFVMFLVFPIANNFLKII